MTDNEIIRCLKNCRAGECENCKALNVCDATFSFHKEALDLINRQKAEIEKLNIESETLATQLKGAYEQIHKLNMAKSEAIKEFADRFKCGVPQETGVIRRADVDNLVK